jgi:hypothetical protein
MTTSGIIHAIDSEIERLRQARVLLIDVADSAPSVKRGRPKGSTSQEKPLKAKKASRSISPEGKARIAAAQKARWAVRRKAAKSAKRSVAVVAKKAVEASRGKSAKKTSKTLPAKSKAAVETPASSSPAGSDSIAT